MRTPIEMKCPTHPRYRAIQKPRCECKTCHGLYNFRVDVEAKVKRIRAVNRADF